MNVQSHQGRAFFIRSTPRNCLVVQVYFIRVMPAVWSSRAFVNCYSTNGMFMKLPSTDANVVRSFLEKGIWIGTYSSHARGSVLKNTCRTDVSANPDVCQKNDKPELIVARRCGTKIHTSNDMRLRQREVSTLKARVHISLSLLVLTERILHQDACTQALTVHATNTKGYEPSSDWL